MIYGEVVQKWRLAKGATLRKWPHAAGTALSHISRNIAQVSNAEQSIGWKRPGGPLSTFTLICGLYLTTLPACHVVRSALMQHDATILRVIRESSVRCTGQTALKRQDLSRTHLAHHELESKSHCCHQYCYYYP